MSPWWGRPVLVPVPTRLAQTLGQVVVEIALGEVGLGETEDNNRGPTIRKYTGGEDGGEWCAAFAGWCYEQAAGRLGVPLPFPRSLGAKRLAKNLAAAGQEIGRPEDARAGDLIAWHRGAQGSWQGHVGIIQMVAEGGLLHTIEGNSGRFPAKVRRLVHDARRERLALIAGFR